MNLHLDEKNLSSRNSVCNILESDFYGQGLGCMVSVILSIKNVILSFLKVITI